jgi:unsaturated rhamnogalacturonyl hydrolase
MKRVTPNWTDCIPTVRILVLAGVMMSHSNAAGLNGDEAIIRRVADEVVKQTTRRLVDGRTGRTVMDNGELQPVSEIRIESKFNAWFYQTWLLADGMRRTAVALDEPAFRNYGERNLDFIYQHMAFFEKQHAAGMPMAPVGDGKLSPIGFYFKIDALWHTGLAPLVMERHAETKDPRYERYLERVTRFLERCPRFEDGAFYRAGKGMMTDDPFMTVPFLLRKWKAGGEARDLDLAIAQILGTHDRLFDRGRGLLRHLWDLKTKQPAGVFWGRGNGWMVLAHVDLLAKMPREHPRRAEVLAAFVRHMEGIRRCQDPVGGWHQVLDHPESWIETSCTGMFVYGLARGVNEGWLDVSFSETARKGWEALKKKVTADGDLVDVCGSTDVGDLAFYLNRPRLQGDLHGFGSFLLAGAEILRMEKKPGGGADGPGSTPNP